MKFSLFKRSNGDGQPEDRHPEPPPERLHDSIPEAEELQVNLCVEGEPPILVELIDMNIQGAQVVVPFHQAPLGSEGAAVILDVSHPDDGWRVRATAQVQKITKCDEQFVSMEVQFTRLGELYAQLDDALGRYFNRRSARRVKPDIDTKVSVRLAYGPHRVRGEAHDLSRSGIGVVAPLVQASIFRSGERVRIFIDLPGNKEEFEALGVIKHGYRNGEEVLLGIEYDLLSDTPMRERRGEYLEYVEERREAIEAWQRSLSRGA
ncbi:MAG: PilZ domain-containing protein [Planctomycetota bacterium]